jgi:hypothetical protein
MFVFEIGICAYNMSYDNGVFVAKSQRFDGDAFEDGAVALAEIAYFQAQKKAEYMPTAEMIEFYTAREMGVEIEPPGMDSELGFIY